MRLIWLVLLLTPALSFAQTSCGEMEIWDYAMAMCMPRPVPQMPMRMLMLQGNGFATGVNAEGPRGGHSFSAPNMFMADFGSTVGAHHYFNIDLMATAEKWTVPARGTPELTQIGDTDQNDRPYVDHQHPHPSPIMGLTFSDTISLGKNFVKIYFAPRGESGEGPVSFMHRPTGMVNPSAPLGHHIGQDVGHVTSTVVGAVYGWQDDRIEVSAFNGTEPDPAKVTLPLGPLNSGAVRFTHLFSESWYAMVSGAYVKNPERLEPDVETQMRYSASVYTNRALNENWHFQNAFILGTLAESRRPNERSLNEEFVFAHESDSFWGRIELVERSRADLEISTDEQPKWISAFTVGYTRRIAEWSDLELSLGASLTKYVLPAEYHASYNDDPWSELVFLQMSGMKMWEL
jgi:hypothetical protein